MYKLSKPNISDDDINAVVEVLQSGNLVYGAKGREFEAALEQFMGIGSANVVSSGTSALYVALKSLDIGEGDAVIVPGFTFPATLNAVVICGAVPVLCDVDSSNYCIDVEAIRNVIDNWQGSAKIKAIMPVHEFGHPADMLEINQIASEYGLFVVEDAACAIGSTLNGQHLGTFGDIGCFSFHPRKMLTTGEGGAVVTASAHIASKIKKLRNHGISFNEGAVGFDMPALNFRLTDIQSAMGIVQLTKISEAINKRHQLATKYSELLHAEKKISLPELSVGQNWQTYMIVLDDSINRGKIIRRLKELNVETNLGAQSMSQLQSFQPYLSDNVETPISDRLYQQGLALPLTEQYSLQDIEVISQKLLDVLDGHE